MVKRLIPSFAKNRGLHEISHHNKNTLEAVPKINIRQLVSILKDYLLVKYTVKLLASVTGITPTH